MYIHAGEGAQSAPAFEQASSTICEQYSVWQPLLAQEALLCSLLDVALNHHHALAALSEDALMELCDIASLKIILYPLYSSSL